MPVDLTAIRALLASVAGFTPGPWRLQTATSGLDDHAAVKAGGYLVVEDAPDATAALIAAAPDLHRELTEAVGEIERLRAHNALAEACDHEESAPPGSFPICDALPPGHWPETAAALRCLAAGEVDDG